MKVRVTKNVKIIRGLRFKILEGKKAAYDLYLKKEKTPAEARELARLRLEKGFIGIATKDEDGFLTMTAREGSFKKGMLLEIAGNLKDLYRGVTLRESFQILDAPVALVQEDIEVPAVEEIDPDSDLIAVIIELDPKDLTRDGDPKVKAVSEALGRDVSRADIERAQEKIEDCEFIEPEAASLNPSIES
jgi:hypothetical protein